MGAVLDLAKSTFTIVKLQGYITKTMSRIFGYNSEQTLAWIVPSVNDEIVFSPRSIKACEQIVTSVSLTANCLTPKVKLAGIRRQNPRQL